MTFIQWLSEGFWNLSPLGLVAYTLILTHITIVTVTVYLHRHGAHRAVDLHPAVQHFFRFWNWLTTGMVTAEWVAVHRKHHALCETEEDPHSPQVQGLKKIFWRGAETYGESANAETVAQYGAGTPNDWIEKKLYGKHRALGVASMLIIDVALFGVIGLTVWAVQMLWIPVLAAGVVNGIGHVWGYRNFECPDAATNISPIGLIIGGEELHNNHHTYPNSAKLSVKPWEFDMGWFWIRVLQVLGLAKPRSTGPVVAQVPGKLTLDADTAWALLNDRFRVMSQYAKSVVSPAVEKAYAVAEASDKALLHRADRVLCREESLLDEDSQAKISKVVSMDDDLKVTYEMRLRLQELWGRRGAGVEQVLQGLTDWCRDAEASGNKALQDFVKHMKSYSMPVAAKT